MLPSPRCRKPFTTHSAWHRATKSVCWLPVLWLRGVLVCLTYCGACGGISGGDGYHKHGSVQLVCVITWTNPSHGNVGRYSTPLSPRAHSSTPESLTAHASRLPLTRVALALAIQPPPMLGAGPVLQEARGLAVPLAVSAPSTTLQADLSAKCVGQGYLHFSQQHEHLHLSLQLPLLQSLLLRLQPQRQPLARRAW